MAVQRFDGRGASTIAMWSKVFAKSPERFCTANGKKIYSPMPIGENSGNT